MAALDRRGGIGRDGGIPWHLRDDLRHFRRLTMGHHVLMGRRTYATVAGGKLPGRTLLVLSRDVDFHPTDARVFSGFQAAVAAAQAAGEDELFVIGGAQVFAEALPQARRMYLTQVETDADCDVFFPEFDMEAWQQVSRKDFPAGKKNDYAFSILALERKPAGN